MEIQKIGKVKEFVKEALNLPDNCSIKEYTVVVDENNQITLSAKITAMFNAGELLAKSVKTNTNSNPIFVKKEKINNNSNSISWKVRNFEINEEDFKFMRKLLAQWRKEGVLISYEIEQIVEYAGIFYKSMTDEQRKKFLDLFNNIKERIKGIELKD